MISRTTALESFGGDASFFKQMCDKFVPSCRGVVERIGALVDALPISYADLRREAHSMKGAASTIGAMQLSQAALDLQLAAERVANTATLRELAAHVRRHFVMVEAALVENGSDAGDAAGESESKSNDARTAAEPSRRNGNGPTPQHTTRKLAQQKGAVAPAEREQRINYRGTHGGHQGGAPAFLGRTRIPVRRGFEHRRPSTGVGAAAQ